MHRRLAAYKKPAAVSRIFCADTGGGVSYSDDDGVTWTRVTTELSGGSWDTCVPVNGTVVAMPWGSSYYNPKISTDRGESFAAATGTTQKYIYQVAHNGAGVICAGYGEGTVIWRSADYGASWSQIAPGSWSNLRSIAYSPTLGRWICCARGDRYLYASTAGTSWSNGTSSGNAGTCYGARWLNGLFFMCLAYGYIAYSATGYDGWTVVNIGTSEAIYDIAFDGTTYYAISDYGLVIKSTDLSSWTQVQDFNQYIRGIRWTGTALLIGGCNGSNGTIRRSTDGFATYDLVVNSSTYAGCMRFSQET